MNKIKDLEISIEEIVIQMLRISIKGVHIEIPMWVLVVFISFMTVGGSTLVEPSAKVPNPIPVVTEFPQ